MITFNNLELTKGAVDSALAQDIAVEMVIVNNGSTDGTGQWLSDLGTMVEGVTIVHFAQNTPPTHVANTALANIFPNRPHVLCIPNDVRIPKNCYSKLLEWPRGFVCASDNGQNEPIEMEATAVSENTPMAVMLVRKWAYDALIAKDGYFFDERFEHYTSDCDMALRMASCGIRGVQLNIPFWHYGSAAWKLATDSERSRMLQRADDDRRKFVEKWGFAVTALEYGQRALDINFKG